MTSASNQELPALLAVAKTPPPFLEGMKGRFTVYERLHETDPAAFAKVAGTIRGVCGGGAHVRVRAARKRRSDDASPYGPNGTPSVPRSHSHRSSA